MQIIQFIRILYSQ